MSNILVVGSINMDLILQMPHMPVVGETIRATKFQTVAGGKGFNQAVAIKRMGSDVSFYGYLGNDPYGHTLRNQFMEEGIDTALLKNSTDLSTGMAFIFLDEQGHNSIVVEPGSNLSLKPEEFIEVLYSQPQISTLVVQMEIPLDVIEAVLTEGKRQGKKVVLNPSPFQPLKPELLEGLDTLVLNEIEAEQMTGLNIPELQIKALQEMGIQQIILTLGELGVYYNNDDEILFQKAFKTTVVDTTGAGDTFLGTYVSQRNKGGSLKTAVENAAKAGAIAVSRMGAIPSIPFEKEIL